MGKVPLLAATKGPVIDLGCGRGELVELLKQADIPAKGVDSNAPVVADCRERAQCS